MQETQGKEKEAMRTLLVRAAFCVVLVASFVLTVAVASATQAPAGPTLDVANPSAGDTITPGKLIMEGVAFDPVATTGTGVDRVSVFLGDRETGGQFLGDAVLGQPNTTNLEDVQFATSGWMLTTPVLSGAGDGETMFIYARSAVTGTEAVMQIPIVIGESSHALPTVQPVQPVAPIVQPAAPAIQPTGDYILPPELPVLDDPSTYPSPF
jgi:hypothetical protein